MSRNFDLDLRIAEELMGWCTHPHISFIDPTFPGHLLERARCKKCGQSLSPAGASWLDEWSPSSNLTAAEQVMDRLLELGVGTVTLAGSEGSNSKEASVMWTFCIGLDGDSFFSTQPVKVQAIAEAVEKYLNYKKGNGSAA